MGNKMLPPPTPAPNFISHQVVFFQKGTKSWNVCLATASAGGHVSNSLQTLMHLCVFLLHLASTFPEFPTVSSKDIGAFTRE